MNYTIILNLGGNLVTQLTQAEQQLVRINGLAQKINGGSGTRTASGIGGTVGGGRLDRLYNISQRLGSGQTQEQFNRRFNEAFKHIQRFQNDFIRNSFTISGFRRNFGNFVGSVDAFASAITNAVPVLGAASSALKAFALSSAVPVVVGGLAYSAGSKFLNSRNIREATSDRLQFEAAERGLGSEYAEALRGASTIASQYGISRAQALANINILSGLETESGSISYGQANDITRAAAIIGSFGSVPFERVAQNLQQILSVNEPNARDIRELIHQAPILSKYALQDLQSRGEIGDPREYYKDRDNLLQGLYRLLEEFRVPRSAEIRGRQELTRRDFYLNAERQLEPLFEEIGNATTKLYAVLTDAVNNFSASFDERKVALLFQTFIDGVDAIGQALPKVVGFLTDFTIAIEAFGDNIVALWKTLTFRPLQGLASFNRTYERIDQRQNILTGEKVFDIFARDFIKQELSNYERVRGESPFSNDAERDTQLNQLLQELTQNFRGNVNWQAYGAQRYIMDFGQYNSNPNASVTEFPGIDLLPYNELLFYIAEFFKRVGNDSSSRGVNSVITDTNDIETLTKGSRSLHIYFQAPLAEVNNNITTGANAQEIVDRFETQTVDIVSRVLQEAIYNATLIS